MAESAFTLLQHTIFDILLPTQDVLGDMNFVLDAFYTQHYRIGCLMMFPVLLSMTFNFYKWFWTDFDSKKEKRYTWMLVILGMWPQYQVLKLILSIIRGKSKNIWKLTQDKIKKDLTYIEPFVEAIPELFIQIGVWAFLLGKHYQELCPKNGIGQCITEKNNPAVFRIYRINFRYILSVDVFSKNDTAITEVFGKTTLGIDNNIMFYLNILSSAFSGIKCIVDYLHNGPLNITSNTKFGRAVVLSSIVVNVVLTFFKKYVAALGYGFGLSEMQDGIWVFLLTFFMFIAFPVLIFVCPLARVVGLKTYTRMILKHPEVFVLPLVTEFVPGPFGGGRQYRSCCPCCKCWSFCTWSYCCKVCDVVHTNKVVISKEMSWTKMLYMHVFFLHELINAGIHTNDMGELVRNLIGASLTYLSFGIILHYGKSKKVLVIEKLGDTRAELKQELELKLQEKINVQSEIKTIR